MPVDTRHVDVDLSVPPEGFESGLLEMDERDILAASRFGSGNFEDEYPQLMLTKERRHALARERQASFRADTRKIYSQSNSSACVGFGSAQCLETSIVRQHGHKNWVPLSGMWVYSGIGRSYSSGAYIPDGMNEIAENGACPLATDLNIDKGFTTWALLNFDRTRPTETFVQAKEFRVTKYAVARGEDAIESALAQGFCGIVGRERHCVPYTYLDFDSKGNPFAAYANSWDVTWGDQGFGYDSRRTYSQLSLYLAMEIKIGVQILKHSGLPQA